MMTWLQGYRDGFVFGLIVGAALTVFAVVLIAALAGQANAHDLQIVHCDRNLKVERVLKLGEETQANGTLEEYYDRNGDGRTDIIAISSLYGASEDLHTGEVIHTRFPFMYIVDLDLDGEFDQSYIDVGDGKRCEDIIPYLDLHKNLDDGRRMDSPGGGQVGAPLLRPFHP